MKVAKIAVPVLSLALVVLIAIWETERTTPGELAPRHRDAVARNGGSCELCHGDEALTSSAACGTCHASTLTQVHTGTGFHGTLDAEIAGECASCHTEHHGDQFPLISQRSYALSGYPTRSVYDHAGLDFALKGAHRSLGCVECHAAADHPIIEEGGARFTGLSQECAACHDDPHDGGFGVGCAACHGQSAPFQDVASFAHTAAFALEKAHAQPRCSACHAQDTQHAVGSLLARPGQTARTCRACHENPHGTTTDGGVRAALYLPATDDCTQCHDTQAFASAQYGVAQHAAIGVHLAGPHAEAACVTCHAEDAAPRSSAPAAVMALCVTCHAAPHDAQFLDKVAPANCADCHTEAAETFRGLAATISPAQHAATGFPLTVPHADLECARCHQSDAASTFDERYPGRVANDCNACHGDPHEGQFDKGPFSKKSCLDCHERHRFTPSRFDTELHAQSRFPLTGAHEAVACNACHKSSGASSTAARMPRAARRFDGVATSCAACHRDVHRGAFDRPGRPARVNEQTSCDRCHGTATFRDQATTRFDHETWTGTALRGAHARATCASCHASINTPQGRELQPAPTSCDGCHTDPHVGQFRLNDVNDCSRCHDESRRFADLTFDHQKDARFALDATHRNVSCDGCHPSQALTDGRRVTRYRPLGRRCQDCHSARRGDSPEEER